MRHFITNSRFWKFGGKMQSLVYETTVKVLIVDTMMINLWPPMNPLRTGVSLSSKIGMPIQLHIQNIIKILNGCFIYLEATLGENCPLQDRDQGDKRHRFKDFKGRFQPQSTCVKH